MSETRPLATPDLHYPASPTAGHLPLGAEHFDAERQAVELARTIFPGPVQIEDGLDPEDPEYRQCVVTVMAIGDVADISARSRAWHQAMIDQLGARGAHITICVKMTPT